MITRRPALAVAAALVAVPVVLTASAAAAPPETTWGPVRTLTDYAWDPDVVVDGSSNVTAVWADNVRRGPIRAVDLPAGGLGWGDPVIIGRGTDPQVAADANGNLTAVWNTNRRGWTTGVAGAFRPAGGDWQAPVRLSRDREARSYNPYLEDPFGAGPVDLAVAPDGTAVAVWQWGSFERERPLRVQSVHRQGSGDWGDPVDVTDPNWSGDPSVAIGATGSSVLVYAGRIDRPGSPLWARMGAPTGEWSTPTRLTRDGYMARVAVDAAGNALAVFSEGFTTIRAAYRPAAGPWQEAQSLSPAGVDVEVAELALDGSGNATVVWSRSSGRVDLVTRPAGGDWSAPVMLADRTTGGYAPALAVNASGDTFAMWGTWDLFARFTDGGEWTGILPVTSKDQYVENRLAAVYPNGTVVVLWVTEKHALLTRSLYIGG